jgi:pentatricopeptide repeat protein
LRVDQYLTLLIEEVLQTHKENAANQAYTRFCNGLQANKAPSSLTMGRMIQALGRIGEMDKVSYAYTVAQRVLHLLEHNKSWQAEAWLTIEDSMIIALAHHGDVDSAHVHRTRILDHGGAPTADAYGALILNIKDTTDDASNAMSLFQESQMRGVAPNQFLYNNIISKLAKARKADYALELFQQMKSSKVHPSSITYGAVIGACARVGDIQSAELLFSEMVQARNFKPRVPPYNTMMQMYTTTKPNRERALYFYRELQKAGVAPTAHTYKVGLSL